MDYVPEIPVPTAEQTEFFKKSVCKGEDGILIPFFHGTGTEITEFEMCIRDRYLCSANGK